MRNNSNLGPHEIHMNEMFSSGTLDNTESIDTIAIIFRDFIIYFRCRLRLPAIDRSPGIVRKPLCSASTPHTFPLLRWSRYPSPQRGPLSATNGHRE